jgi:hypothetical protein
VPSWPAARTAKQFPSPAPSSHGIINRMGPGADGLPGDDRIEAAGKQRNDCASVISGVELSVAAVKQLVNLVHHASLMFFVLCACRRSYNRAWPSRQGEGMHRAIAEDPTTVLEQQIYAGWTREKRPMRPIGFINAIQMQSSIWAGNDVMALGAMVAWEKRGGHPGVDAWFSGIDTSTEALEGIKSGRLTSLAGGHFITGAWALVILYDYHRGRDDYHRGRDFTDEGFELRRPLFVEITPQLAERYFERFSGGFDSIDLSSSATASVLHNY